MLAASLILVISGALFLYWFRYSCLLILQTRTGWVGDGESNRLFSFPRVRERLDRDDVNESLDDLDQKLLSDYAILKPLIARVTESGVDPVERWLLVLDYKLMRIWFRVSRRTSAPAAKRALAEMAEILGYFASCVEPKMSQINA